jgi:hypothetical protein
MKGTVRRFRYSLELYRDAQSPEYKKYSHKYYVWKNEGFLNAAAQVVPVITTVLQRINVLSVEWSSVLGYVA